MDERVPKVHALDKMKPLLTILVISVMVLFFRGKDY